MRVRPSRLRSRATSKCAFVALITANALFATSKANASLLVYEGFNGYTATSNLNGQTPNANTIGLSTADAYAGQGTYTVSTGSIAFGSSNLLTTGDRLTFSNGTTNVASGKLNLASPYDGAGGYVGTLYSSYIVTLTGRGGAAGDGFEVRTGNDTASSGARYRALADSRNSSTNLAAFYEGGTLANSSNGTGSLPASTPTFVVSRFTNVGTTLSAANQGVQTSYAMTAAQYDSFVAAGRTDSYLDNLAAQPGGAGIGTGASQISAYATQTASSTSVTNLFATGNYTQFVSVADSGALDEIRWGTTLADVTPLPEPTAAATLGLMAAAGATRRRRRVTR